MMMRTSDGQRISDAQRDVRVLRLRNYLLWLGCALVWLLFDRGTKGVIDGSYQPGDVMIPNILGIISIDLVHNTGVAWGAFSGAVPLIAVVTSVLCIVIAGFSIYWARGASIPEMVGLALLFAGGLGNLSDRIVCGYVIDFITPLFIDFPTFNFADVGVTCGIVLLAICWITQLVKEECAFADRDHKED